MKKSIQLFTAALGLCGVVFSGAAAAQLNVPIIRTLPMVGDPPIGVLGKLPVLSELDQALGLVDLLGANALPDIEPLLLLERQLNIGSLLALGGAPGLDALPGMDGLPGLDGVPGLDALPLDILLGFLPM